MGSFAEEKAALALGVTAVAAADGTKGLFYRAASSTSNTILTLPAKSATDLSIPMRRRWFAIFSKSSNVQYAFSNGAAGAALTYNALVTAGTGSATAGATVPNGIIYERIIPSDANFLSIISEAATDYVEVYITDGPG